MVSTICSAAVLLPHLAEAPAPAEVVHRLSMAECPEASHSEECLVEVGGRSTSQAALAAAAVSDSALRTISLETLPKVAWVVWAEWEWMKTCSRC